MQGNDADHGIAMGCVVLGVPICLVLLIWILSMVF